MLDWLRELLGVPEREYTRFEAALSECSILGPDEVIRLLTQRLEGLDAANGTQRAFPGINDWRRFFETGQIPEDVTALMAGEEGGAASS